MKTPDLSDYTLGELKGLLFDVDAELARRARAQKDALKLQAREQILAIVQDAGLSMEALLGEAEGLPAPPRKQKH